MLHDDIKAFAGAAAIVLSGRDDVQVYFDKEDEVNEVDFPEGRRAYAEKSSDGKPAIHIKEFTSARWNADAFVESLCHEAAHVLLHWDYMSGGVPLDGDNSMREREAKNAAKVWSTFAKGYGETYYQNFPASSKAECPYEVVILRQLCAIADRVNYDGWSKLAIGR